MGIKETTIKVMVKPNSARNEFIGFDKEKNAYRISIKAKPEQNKANIELIKFLSKLLKKKITIISGLISSSIFLAVFFREKLAPNS